MSINKYTKFSLISFIVWFFPFLVNDTGIGILNFDFIKNNIRSIYEILFYGWTDYGSPFILLLTVILSIIALKQKDKSKYDYIINILILIPGILLFWSFIFVLFVVSLI